VAQNDLTKLLFLSPSDLVFYLAELSSLVGVHVGTGEGLDVGMPHLATSCWIRIDPKDFMAIPQHSFPRFYATTSIIKVLAEMVCIIIKCTYTPSDLLVHRFDSIPSLYSHLLAHGPHSALGGS